MYKKVADHRQRTAGTLPPAVAHGDAVVVETNPGAGYQLRVHQDEPAIGVVLGGAGFAGYVSLNAKTCTNGDTGALVHHTAHRINQNLRTGQRDTLLRCLGLEGLQHLAFAVGHAQHQKRLNVIAVVGNRGVAGHHLLQSHRAGAQRQRGHFFKLALAHTHGLRQVGHAAWANALHDLRSDGVFGIDQAAAQTHHLAAWRAGVAGPPDLAAAQRYLDRLVHEAVGCSRAVFKRCAIDKRLEGRARLAPRLLHMVKRVFGKVAATYPGLHMAVTGIERQKTGLQPRFFLAQRQHESAVGQQRL